MISRDDEDENVKVFPVVEESAGKLLDTGINTLQKTLLLKKEVEVLFHFQFHVNAEHFNAKNES